MFAALTPLRLQRAIQTAFALCVVAAAVLMLGPFQGAEGAFGLSDTEAHAIAFYGLTVGLFLSVPRTRRTDLALVAFGFGALIEIVQSQVGRSMSLSDLAADSVGIAAALAPGMIERLRHQVRANPYLSFRQIAQRERRVRRPAKASAPRAVPEQA
jgi:VanZ family protein